MTTAQSRNEVTSADFDSVPIFAGLDRQTLETIAAEAIRVEFPAGETILTRGAPSKELYAIESGRVEVFRHTGAGDFGLETLDPGDILGEIDVLAGAPRTTSARALDDVTLIRISPDKLTCNHHENCDLCDVTARLGSMAARRIHHVTNHYIDALEREVALAKAQKHAGTFLIYLIVLFSISGFFSYFFLDHIIDYNYQVSWAYLLSLCVPGVFLIWYMKLPLSEFGITRVGLGKSIREGLIASAIVFAGTAALVFGSQAIGMAHPFRIHWDQFDSAYALSAFLQEFTARGLFQNSLQRFLGDKKGYLSVLLVSILFCLFHIQFGLLSVALVFVASLIFGLFYLRHHNLVGVWLLHISLGYSAVLLGYV